MQPITIKFWRAGRKPVSLFGGSPATAAAAVAKSRVLCTMSIISYHHNTIIPHSPYPLHALVDVSSRTLFSFSVHPVLSSWQCVANLQFSWDVNSVLDAFFRDLEQDRGQNKGRIWCTNSRHQALIKLSCWRWTHSNTIKDGHWGF